MNEHMAKCDLKLPHLLAEDAHGVCANSTHYFLFVAMSLLSSSLVFANVFVRVNHINYLTDNV